MSDGRGADVSTADLYDAIFATKDYEIEAEYIRELIKSHHANASTLLDVGCGSGRHLEVLQKHFSVSGLDLDAEMLEAARRRLEHPRLHLGDLRDFDLGEQFDVVACLNGSIGHALTQDGLRAACASMARHLAPGGLMIIEPFYFPDTFEDGRIIVDNANDGRRAFVRMVRLARIGEKSGRLETIFLVGDPEFLTESSETYEMGLFELADYAVALDAAGLEYERDPEGRHPNPRSGLVLGHPR